MKTVGKVVQCFPVSDKYNLRLFIIIDKISKINYNRFKYGGWISPQDHGDE